MHEQIENEYIIGLLQQRSQTVYNVHSDNKLSEMLSLFEKGLKNVKVRMNSGSSTIRCKIKLRHYVIRTFLQPRRFKFSTPPKKYLVCYDTTALVLPDGILFFL